MYLRDTWLYSKRAGAIASAVVLAMACSSVARAQSLSYVTSWIGNTFGGATGANGFTQKHIPMDIDTLFTASDGTCYTNSNWEEGSGEESVLLNGDILGHTTYSHGSATGWAVGSSPNYFFASNDNGTSGFTLFNSTISSGTYPFYQFTNGHWHTTSDGPGPNIVLSASATAACKGIAATSTEVYVSDDSAGQIKVYTINSNMSQSPVRSWNLSNPRAIAIAGDGSLWILQASGSTGTGGQVVHCSNTGTNLGSTVTLAGNVVPTGIAIDSSVSPNRLLVADNGPDQNVKIYNTGSISGAPTTITTTLGATGGIHSGTDGVVAPLKFNGLTGVGADSSGNLYVAQNGGVNSDNFVNDDGYGAVLEKYNSSGSRQWALYGLEFVDSADVDTSSETDVYTAQEHFKMDYSQGPGQGWTYTGFSLDRFAYPQDPRLFNSLYTCGVRRIGGQKFMFLTDMYTSRVAAYRFSGEIAIPCAYFSSHVSTSWPANQPSSNDWVWQDSNGNGQFDSGEYTGGNSDYSYIGGWYVDANGNVWKETRNGVIYEYRCTGVNSNGTLAYDTYTSRLSYTVPSAVVDPQRINYIPSTDTMYISGYDTAHPKSSGSDGNESWTVTYRYDNWTTSRTLHSGYPIAVPYNRNAGSYTTAKGIDICGGYVFVQYYEPHQCLVYNADTGASVGTITPGSEVGGPTTVGDTDIPNPIHVYQRSTGEFLIFTEDDGLAKVLMYRWTPPSATPPAPTGLGATGGNTSVALTWTASSGATSYNVYRGTSSNGESSTAIATGITTTSYNNTGLSNGTTYYYKVAAVNSGGTSEYSNEAYATPSAGSTTIQINVGGSAATPYVADEYGSGGNITTTSNSVNTSLVTNAAPQAVYQSERWGSMTYTIPGLNAGSSYTVRLHMSEYTDPGVGQRKFNVAINGTSVLSNYDIYAATGALFKAITQSFTATANGSGQIVIAFTVGAADQPVCSGIEVTGGASAPGAPTGLNATGASGQVSLTWNTDSGATSYSVYRGTSSGGESTTAIATGVTGTAYSDTSVSNGTTYYYKITATGSGGTSGYSNEASATPNLVAVVQINVGGSASSPFVADEYYSGGNVTTTSNTINTSLVANPAPQAVYQSERWGGMTYTIPGLTSGASYTVRLHMSEYTDPGVGQREYNVAINGTAVLTNYDIYAATGALFKAVEKTFTTTANTSGQIVIAFTTGAADQPVCSGIEVLH